MYTITVKNNEIRRTIDAENDMTVSEIFDMAEINTEYGMPQINGTIIPREDLQLTVEELCEEYDVTTDYFSLTCYTKRDNA